MCTHKGAEILTNQSIVVFAASCNQNLNEGEREVCRKKLHSCLI